MPEIALAVIVGQSLLLVSFTFAGKRMWKVLASNVMLTLAVGLLLATLIDMDRERDRFGVAIDALTRLRERMEVGCR